MDTKQEKIFNWLKEYSVDLAELYAAAVKIIEDDFPGKIYLVSHCVREMGNRLPIILQNKKYGFLEYPKYVESIAEQWGKENLSKYKILPAELNVPIVIPYAFYEKLNNLVEKHNEVSHNIEDKYLDLLKYIIPENAKEPRINLRPAIQQIINLIKYFQKLTHVRINENQVVETSFKNQFSNFEKYIYILISDYYSNLLEFEDLMAKANENNSPTEGDVNKIIGFFSRPQFKSYFFKNLKNKSWLLPLKDKGFFDWKNLNANEYVDDSELHYIEEIAFICPKEVLSIIDQNNDCANIWVKTSFIKSLLKIPNILIEKRNINSIVCNKPIHWFHQGLHLAELMVKLSNDKLDLSFCIAKKLLEIPADKKTYNDLDIEIYGYMELLSKYYKKFSEKDAFRAFNVLFIKLENHLKKIKEQEGYDATSFLASDNFKNIDEIEKADLFGEKIELIILAGLRDIGKEVLSKQPEKTDKLFGLIEKYDFKIFKHLEIYLLRFARIGEQKERIKKTLSDNELFDESSFYNEYTLLIKNKIDELDDTDIKQILKMLNSKMEEASLRDQEWVKKNPGSKDFDIKKHKAGRLAKWLYTVRELNVFSKMYEENKSESGLEEEKLKPEPRRPLVEDVDGCEGSVISFDEMIKLEPEATFEELKKPGNWKYAGGRWGQDKEGDAISQVFEEVVEQRVDDYVVIEPDRILELKPIFVNGYVDGLVNACAKNEEKLKEYWLKILHLGLCLHEAKGNDNEYEWTFINILSFLGNVLEVKELKDKLISENFNELWKLIEFLCKHHESEVEKDNFDPFQRSNNCVQGKAFELAIRFSLVCRNIAEEKYEKELSSKLIGVLDYLLGNVKLNKIRCIWGVWFPQIHLLANDWAGKNINRIFNEKDYADWNVVWGSYLNWSRAYKDTFAYLAKTGKYDFAIENIHKEDKYKRSKVPAQGLIEHLMIAFFNEWINADSPLLKKFYSTGIVAMKGKAANFLSGGFKALKEEPKDGIVSRLREFWDVRLQACEKDSSLKDEIIEFTNWVKETPFDKKETLELLYRTLCLTNGEVGKLNSNVRVINGICEIAENNELLALKCLNRIEKKGNFEYGFSLFKDKFIGFIEKVADLPDSFPNLKEIKKEAVVLVNEVGPLQIYDFGPFYKKLVS